MRPFIRLLTLAAALSAPLAHAEILTKVYDFESTLTLADPSISGDVTNFKTTTSLTFAAGATGHGLQALHFTDAQEPYESFTYALPADLKTGTVSLWFKEDFITSSSNPTWGLSFLIEDANNPKDWGALEVSDFGFAPFIPAAYYATEGSVDRRKPADKYDSTLLRTPNVWHQLVFDIRTTGTLISLDGALANDVAGPGSEVTTGTARTLRLRVLANTPSLGGRKNYLTNDNVTTTALGFPAVAARVHIDDLSVSVATPTPSTGGITFEGATAANADYDLASVNLSPIKNVAELKGFVNRFKISTDPANVRTGGQSAYFDPGDHRLRKLAIDLNSIHTTSGTITLYFYDSVGAANGQNRFGGSIVLQSGTNPAQWVALEVTNFAFPISGDPTPGASNYFLSRSTGSAGTDPANGFPYRASFYSRYFGDRSVGWHKVEIKINGTQSQIILDGVENSGNYYTLNPPSGPPPNFSNGIFYGPGLNSNPRLLILADSASGGGLGPNFVDLGELYTLYNDSASNPAFPSPYLIYDDLTIPVTAAPNAVRGWELFE